MTTYRWTLRLLACTACLLVGLVIGLTAEAAHPSLADLQSDVIAEQRQTIRLLDTIKADQAATIRDQASQITVLKAKEQLRGNDR